MMMKKFSCIALLAAMILLSACANMDLNPYTGKPPSAEESVRLASIAEYPAEKITITVIAINEKPVSAGPDIALMPDTYRITLKIVHDANFDSSNGTTTTSWKEGQVILQEASLKAGHRYKAASTINGMVVKARLEDTTLQPPATPTLQP